jgi:hypothetical protein
MPLRNTTLPNWLIDAAGGPRQGRILDDVENDGEDTVSLPLGGRNSPSPRPPGGDTGAGPDPLAGLAGLMAGSGGGSPASSGLPPGLPPGLGSPAPPPPTVAGAPPPPIGPNVGLPPPLPSGGPLPPGPMPPGGLPGISSSLPPQPFPSTGQVPLGMPPSPFPMTSSPVPPPPPMAPHPLDLGPPRLPSAPTQPTIGMGASAGAAPVMHITGSVVNVGQTDVQTQGNPGAPAVMGGAAQVAPPPTPVASMPPDAPAPDLGPPPISESMAPPPAPKPDGGLPPFRPTASSPSLSAPKQHAAPVWDSSVGAYR